ncbi:unnamed protein product [Hermetia illucens]|uniref:PKD/Chitinase domain-containing protein n=1 Tax=Hermetia illucens TaxID=343691 RepID=A0A7R8UF92_HERIL|nr:dyslexia-associated protein KIAA0319-like protein [Hermetia illucens]CAD7078937.1 unnamed protein product [Hermetia illucens]
MMERLVLILLFVLASSDGTKNVDEPVNFGEICPFILQKVFKGSVPVGKMEAGNYTEVTKDDPDLKTCVEDCCLKKSECNVAFMYDKKCYHIKCISNELCLPKQRTDGLSTNLQMVLVTPVNDGTIEDLSWLDILKNSKAFNDFLPSLQDKSLRYWPNSRKYSLSESLENNLPFIPDEEQLPTKRIGQLFTARKGFDSFGNDQQYAIDENDLLAEESAYLPETKVICEVGVDNACQPNEECVRLLAKSRGGICECKRNYRRNEIGECVSGAPLFSGTSLVEKILENESQVNRDSNADSNDKKEKESKKLLEQLTVSVKNKTVRFPEKEVTLAAYVVPDEQTSGNIYKYQWTLITQPQGAVNGTISDQTKDKIKLSNLSEGLYIFKVTVTGNGSYGETMANVTVTPERRINKPPVAVITPKEQTVKLPSSQAILDGSTSTDDDKIVNWHWELLQGPIGYQKKLPETETLQLSDLEPGNYEFKLTVTDSDNVQDSTTANITVLKEKDYPPQANAGADVILYLPHNNVTLNGSLSTDDRGIVSWEWTKDANDQGKAVDMQNTRTPYLELSNLEEGIYTFELKVTDASNQSNTAKVHVFVKPPTNLPPTANAGANMTINLPLTWVTLNGSKSTDDIRVTNYYWRQKSGPNTATIINANSAVANATSLTLGLYVFELVVSDENQNNSSDTVWIKVIQEKNSPPVAKAGGDKSVTLPVSAIYLNGSESYDDLGIVNYTWSRDGTSLATGNIVGTTNYEPVLILTNVVPGRFIFKLTVTDDQGLTSTDTVSIIVHPDPLVLNLVELTLSMGISVLTQSELDSLVQKISLLLGDVKVRVRDLRTEPKTGDAIIIFYVDRVGPDGKATPVSGLEVERILKDKFWRDASILGTTFTDVRTTICQYNCSEHGFCNSVTRACMCDTFWMPSIFYFWGIDEANCDWSILYVAIGIFVGFLLLSGIFWGITCLCRRSHKPRTRTKVQKYALLGTQEDDIPSFTRNTSLTDSETDSDVVFENRTKSTNGVLRSNGVSKNGPKFSTTRLGRRIKT